MEPKDRTQISDHNLAATICSDEAVNQRLSMSLMRLKVQDRNEIGEEIHGVRSLARDETPELLAGSLHKMNVEVERIVSSPRNDKHAFETAQCLPKTFVNDRDFRLTFLRCELFDPIKAADRMITYTDYLLHLFGRRALMEPLNTSFFDDKEAAALREGNIQLLPFRDRSGRRVLVVLKKALSYTPVLRCKIAMYLLHTLTEDIETQRKGFIFLAWGGSDDQGNSDTGSYKIPGSPGYHKRVIVQSGRALEDALPMRLVAFHLCFPRTPFFRLVKAFYAFIAPVKYLSRYIFHFGTKTEMRYKLMGYGIPVEYIPETENGNVKVKYYYQWLKVRKLIENHPTARLNICECPGMNDVLFRRAGSCMAHPGNSLFRDLIESKKDKHEKSNQTEKRDISLSIVATIENRNGRFFKWSTSQTCWEPIMDRSEIRLKVAMSIRDFNRQSKAAQNRQSTKSSTALFQPDYENKRKRKYTDCGLMQLQRLTSYSK